jgi:hypothetical protein
MPLGLMDDIYEFIQKFPQRLDEVEEVINYFIFCNFCITG